MLRPSPICLALFLIINTVPVAADDEQTLARIDEHLDKLQAFALGEGASPARELEQIVFQLPANSEIRHVIEQKLIAALSTANTAGRRVICRQLRVIGTDRCVPVIARLLSDPELSSFARYTLQGIGSGVALKAMHDALDDVPTRLQVGLLNSLANRNYQPMRGDCLRLMDSNDANVAAAAIRALGRLGGQGSVAALNNQRPGVNASLALTIDLALLECAEHLLEGGDAVTSAAVYSNLFKQRGPFQIAGLRGLVAAQPDRSIDLLCEAIQGDDEQLAAAAASLTDQVIDENATPRLVGLLGDLSDERQVLLIKALGMRGDVAAVPAVVTASLSSRPQLRLAAIDALGGLRGAAAVDALLTAVSDNDRSVRNLARASLVRIDDANAYLAEIARSGVEEVALEAIQTLASRKATDSGQLMLELARAESPAMRVAAIGALGVLGDSQSVVPLVGIAAESEATGDLALMEAALGRVLMRINDPAGRARPLLDALPNAAAAARPVLVRLLARAATEDALIAVRAAVKSPDGAISTAAITALAGWPNSAAGPDLIPLMESAPTAELRRQALDGYVRIASASDDPSTMFRNALARVRGLEAQKNILNEIGLNCESFEAIETTQSLFRHPQLKAVAAIATIRIAYKLRLQHKQRVREIIEDVLAKVDHVDVRKRAQEVLNDLDKYQDHILKWVAIGPFVDREIVSGKVSYRTAFGPEQTDTSDLQWQPLTLGIGQWDINLEATFGARDHCSAYVRTMVWSPMGQDVQVEGGSDDSLKIWVNGKQVHERWRTGGCEPRQILVPARLDEGWNELKLKITDHEGGWQFGCRIRKPDGTRLDGLKYDAR